MVPSFGLYPLYRAQERSENKYNTVLNNSVATRRLIYLIAIVYTPIPKNRIKHVNFVVSVKT